MDNNTNGEFGPEEIMEMIMRFNSYLTLKGRPCQTLKRQLERVPVKELRQLAFDYHIDSKNHKKSELVSLIAEVMVDSNVLKQTLLQMPRETRDFLFEVIKEKNGKYESEFESPDLFFNAVQWGLMGMYQDNNLLVFVVTKEVRDAMEKIMADDHFREKLYQYEALEITLRASVNLYGIIKRSDIIEIFRYYFPTVQIETISIKRILNGFVSDREWVCDKGDYLCFPIFEEVSENVIEENYDFAKSYGRYYPDFNDFIQFFYFDFEQESDEQENLFNSLHASSGDAMISQEIISAAISIFRTGGVPDDFDEMLMDEWAAFIDDHNFEQISEAGEMFGCTVHAWVFCGHSYNEICGITTRPNLRVIKGDKQSEPREESKNNSDQTDNSNHQAEKHKPKLRLL